MTILISRSMEHLDPAASPDTCIILYNPGGWHSFTLRLKLFEARNPRVFLPPPVSPTLPTAAMLAGGISGSASSVESFLREIHAMLSRSTAWTSRLITHEGAVAAAAQDPVLSKLMALMAASRPDHGRYALRRGGRHAAEGRLPELVPGLRGQRAAPV
jgi:hypothetical protein